MEQSAPAKSGAQVPMLQGFCGSDASRDAVDRHCREGGIRAFKATVQIDQKPPSLSRSEGEGEEHRCFVGIATDGMR